MTPPRQAAPDDAPAGDRLARWAAHPLGPALLFLSAVAEACLFPAPTEAVFLALAVGRPRRSPHLALLAAAGGLAGAAVGYTLGARFFEGVGRPMLDGYGLLPRFEAVGALYRGSPLLALATSGWTPVPFVLYTVAAGAFGVPLLPFLAGAFAGRALKYAVLAALAWWLGPAVHAWLARHLRLAMVVGAALAAALLLARL
ncbi:MAG TPA: VTT domain-containing protein [Longimicrobiaceae bacterium]|nr:VTT domain-containing protein [Longimicrobiaceae bacterium]